MGRNDDAADSSSHDSLDEYGQPDDEVSEEELEDEDSPEEEDKKEFVVEQEGPEIIFCQFRTSNTGMKITGNLFCDSGVNLIVDCRIDDIRCCECALFGV